MCIQQDFIFQNFHHQAIVHHNHARRRSTGYDRSIPHPPSLQIKEPPHASTARLDSSLLYIPLPLAKHPVGKSALWIWRKDRRRVELVETMGVTQATPFQTSLLQTAIRARLLRARCGLGRGGVEVLKRFSFEGLYL
jgi:hypothetical protein